MDTNRQNAEEPEETAEPYSEAFFQEPLDDETRDRLWREMMDDYQAEFGAFTDEEIAQARADMYG